jgi:hypothetical protein
MLRRKLAPRAARWNRENQWDGGGAYEPTVAQPVNQLAPITRAASGRLQHSALDFIGLLRDFEMFSKPPCALTGAADRQQE